LHFCNAAAPTAIIAAIIMRLLQSHGIDIEPAAHRYIIKMPRYSPGETAAHRTAEKPKRRMA
jgi:hypothetical protein